MISPNIAAWNIRGFSSSNKVSYCKMLVQSLRLDMICILENRIQLQSLSDLNFSNSHLIFDMEASCHNFHCASLGRIWLKRSTDRLSFQPSFFSSQMIVDMVYFGSSTPFLLYVIYASNSQVERKVLWDGIRSISPSDNVPWILMGDFNTCHFSSDKLGGNPLNQNLLNDINSVIFDTNLKDLGSIGPSYTWFNQRTDCPIHIKLDRMMVNEHWAVGNPLVNFANKLKLLKESIKRKRRVNANVMADHIKNLQAKQLACLSHLNDQVNICDSSIKLKNFNIQLEAASSMWFSWVKQRAKTKWLSQGEDDLKFLYSRIRLRRSYKKTAIALAMSTPEVSVSEAIKDSISYFKSLFNANQQLDFDINDFPPGLVVDLDLRNNLTTPFIETEIKKAIFKGPSVCNAIKGFFHNAFIPRSIKAAAIILIPKSSHAESIVDFRSIALCNTSYKIIAKLLAERMKPIMSKIIKENQAGFIKNRISTDNVILANEILQFSRKSSKIRLMCVKYDIKKAFDSVSRHFLLARLEQKGFPASFIKWIEACIMDV
ncbi:uncharacterized protein LOC110105965 [Dendrobium catenatum]|uniref:uncharacterized protein LOC110105965 n=1 Tax=Dendrobium catenatum TaxID=906689 RepID=UPI0009F5FF04|nr:uncharacterized protein LOC110105965 [Dendrobium catenatum]